MDATLKTKWVAALRSGNYKQGRLFLEDQEGGYCCLGVLCVVLGEPTFADRPDFGSDFYSVAYQPVRNLLDNDETLRTLARLNDSGQSFAQIADYIDANL